MTEPAPDDPVEVLRRWEDFGAVWEVVARTPEQLIVSLRRCDDGEEVSRLVSGDPALRAYVEERRTDLGG
jgi:precorrin-4 methylase